VREQMKWIASDAIPEEGAGDDEDGHASKSGDQASARMSGRNSLMDPVGAIRESMNWLASDAIPEEGEEGGAPYGSGDNDSDEEDEDEDGDVVRESMMGNPSALLHPIQAMRDTMEWLQTNANDIPEEHNSDLEDNDHDDVRESMMANPKALLHPVRAVKDAVDWLRSSVTEIQEKEEEEDEDGGGEEKKEEDQEDDADKDDAADEEAKGRRSADCSGPHPRPGGLTLCGAQSAVSGLQQIVLNVHDNIQEVVRGLAGGRHVALEAER